MTPPPFPVESEENQPCANERRWGLWPIVLLIVVGWWFVGKLVMWAWHRTPEHTVIWFRGAGHCEQGKWFGEVVGIRGETPVEVRRLKRLQELDGTCESGQER